jgi:hypothetical protein
MSTPREIVTEFHRRLYEQHGLKQFGDDIITEEGADIGFMDLDFWCTSFLTFELMQDPVGVEFAKRLFDAEKTTRDPRNKSDD